MTFYVNPKRPRDDGKTGYLMTADYLGQLFVLGLSGKRLSSEFEDLFSGNRIGGVILFEENFEGPADLRWLTGHIRSVAEVPPFVMIDQEVRGVNRIKDNMPTLTDQDLSISGDAPQKVKEAFSQTARSLKDLGINVQLAPVVDLSGRACHHVLKGRCLGEDPKLVAKLGALAVEAIQSQGISACAKHFPGLGKAPEDPHLKLARVESSHQEWSQTEAAPFRETISCGVHLVMSTHVIYSPLDESLPATLSEKVIDRCLKRELGFEGLVITDDLTMRGIGERHSIPEVAVGALSAGHQLLLLCRDLEAQKEVLEFVRRAYMNRDLNRERVDRAIAKILDFKGRYVRPHQIAP
jgi:beta-N-acetylhexosaminidase